MPFIPIILLMVVSGFVFIIWFLDKIINDSGKKWVLPLVLLFVIVGGCGLWLYFSYDQEVENEAYYYITEETNQAIGVVVQKVHLGINDSANMNEEFKCILPPKTIIKVWNYEEIQNGINWLNGKNHYEMIIPSDVRYEEAKKKVKVIFNVIDE